MYANSFISKEIASYNDIPPAWVSIHYQSKMKKKMDELGKIDDRILILQLTRSKSNSKKKPKHESREVVLKRAQDKTEK